MLPFLSSKETRQIRIQNDITTQKLLADLRSIEHRNWKVNAAHEQFFCKLGPDSSSHKFSQYLTTLAYTALPIHKDILHGNYVRFHAGNFRDSKNFSRPIAQASDLNHQVNGGRNLPSDGGIRNAQVRHRDHGFQSGESIARRVRVNGGQRAIMTRIHGLQHVERFFAANLTDDYAVGAHT